MPTLNQVQSEVEVSPGNDIGSLELALKTMWEKVRAASDLIGKLQYEKLELLGKVGELEKGLSSVRSDLLIKEQELKRLRAEHAQLMNADGKDSFSEEEKEILKGRIKDIIAKINSHL